MCIAEVQFVVQLKRRRRQYRGLRFDHQLCPDRAKIYSVNKYLSKVLYVAILQQAVSAQNDFALRREDSANEKIDE